MSEERVVFHFYLVEFENKIQIQLPNVNYELVAVKQFILFFLYRLRLSIPIHCLSTNSILLFYRSLEPNVKQNKHLMKNPFSPKGH